MASGINPMRVPFMFADTGIPTFMNELCANNARCERLKVVIAGGAHINDQNVAYNIGEKNLAALKLGLDAYNLRIYHENTGGASIRTLRLEIGSGRSSIKIIGQGEEKV